MSGPKLDCGETIYHTVRAVRIHDVKNIESIFRGLKAVWPILKPVLTYESKLLTLKSE